MRIHTDTLTLDDVTRAASSHGMRGVYVSASRKGSRTRDHAWDLSLTGTSTRRPNSGTGGAAGDDYAATWDEWGMFLAALFELDPRAIAGSPAMPSYAGAEHFHDVTGGRFGELTAPYKHGGSGHRFQGVGAAPDGTLVTYWTPKVSDWHDECTSCEAVRYRIDSAPYLDALNAASVTA